MILETQSCNKNAIAFHLSQGLTFFGFDRSCYGNNDVENHEVRIELGIYLNGRINMEDEVITIENSDYKK